MVSNMPLIKNKWQLKQLAQGNTNRKCCIQERQETSKKKAQEPEQQDAISKGCVWRICLHKYMTPPYLQVPNVLQKENSSKTQNNKQLTKLNSIKFSRARNPNLTNK